MIERPLAYLNQKRSLLDYRCTSMVIHSLKLTTLADNMVYRAGLHGQWGLSFFLELEDRK